MNNLMESLMSQAADNGGKVFVMGAANVGKSSFINRLLTSDYKKGGTGGADRKKTKKDNVPQATVSNLPGTTLNFLKIKMPNGVTMIDTPGTYI
jgi:ribosome biogenesis GTPase A